MSRPAKTPGDREKSAALGEALDAFLKASGLHVMMKHPEVHGVWERIVGADIAAHTRVSRFHRGVLEIAVDSSSLMTEMQFHRAALLQDLRREIKKPFVTNIFFIHKTIEDDDDGSQSKRDA